MIVSALKYAVGSKAQRLQHPLEDRCCGRYDIKQLMCRNRKTREPREHVSENNSAVQERRHYVDIGDSRLFVEERGSGYPVLILHGGPGAVDHRFFGNYLDAL